MTEFVEERLIMIDIQKTEIDAERKRMDALWWAIALIWIGLVLGAQYLDQLPEIGKEGEWWLWIFVGLGPWSLALNGYRSISSLPNPSTWDWIWTAIFVIVGLTGFVTIAGEIIGAGALVVIGIIILARSLTRRE
jgi:hypothetical protein